MWPKIVHDYKELSNFLADYELIIFNDKICPIQVNTNKEFLFMPWLFINVFLQDFSTISFKNTNIRGSIKNDFKWKRILGQFVRNT